MERKNYVSVSNNTLLRNKSALVPERTNLFHIKKKKKRSLKHWDQPVDTNYFSRNHHPVILQGDKCLAVTQKYSCPSLIVLVIS